MAALTAAEDVAPTGWLAVAERGSVVGIRFVVWFAVGVAVYAAYGFRHSRLREN